MSHALLSSDPSSDGSWVYKHGTISRCDLGRDPHGGYYDQKSKIRAAALAVVVGMFEEPDLAICEVLASDQECDIESLSRRLESVKMQVAEEEAKLASAWTKLDDMYRLLRLGRSSNPKRRQKYEDNWRRVFGVDD